MELDEKVLKSIKHCLQPGSLTCEACPYIGEGCSDHLLKDAYTVIMQLRKRVPDPTKSIEIYNDARCIKEYYQELLVICREEVKDLEELQPSTLIRVAESYLEFLKLDNSNVPAVKRSAQRQISLIEKFLRKWGGDGNA